MAAPRYAGFWIRVVAYLIDAIVISIVASFFPDVRVDPSALATDPFEHTRNGSALLSLLYFVGFWALWNGQTPGMRILKLRVMREDGTPVSLVTALIRYLGLILAFIVIFIGVIWVAFDGRKQGWHDKIASTLVVREAAA